jgi:16S rRNA processing protein RimM
LDSPDLERRMTPAAGSPATPEVPQTPGRWVWLARIRRPQGRKGEVFADILTDFPEKFAERRQLWLLREGGEAARRAGGSTPHDTSLPRSIQLKNHWLHRGGVVLHFDGVDSISDAEKLAGMIVAVPYEERAQLGEDEVYIADLAGCVVVDVAKADAPAVVGEIQDVERDMGPVPILVVRGKKGEVLIPFAKDYLRRLDLDAKRVEMALPEGLEELNAE